MEGNLLDCSRETKLLDYSIEKLLDCSTYRETAPAINTLIQWLVP